MYVYMYERKYICMCVYITIKRAFDVLIYLVISWSWTEQQNEL